MPKKTVEELKAWHDKNNTLLASVTKELDNHPLQPGNFTFILQMADQLEWLVNDIRWMIDEAKNG